MSGRVALLTGGRVKIGYQAGIRLLRSGAHLIVTTRFPRDSAARYSREPDFAQWGHRLEIFGLDLRHTPSVEAFCRAPDDHPRPAGFHHQQRVPDGAASARVLRAHDGPGKRPRSIRSRKGAQSLLGAYEGAARLPPPARGWRQCPGADRRVRGGWAHAIAAELSQVPLAARGTCGAEGSISPRAISTRTCSRSICGNDNSWRLRLAEVPSVELLEVHLVNAVAPFILNARLKPLMLRTPERDKHIVNVSAVEGQFYRRVQDDAPPAYQHGQSRPQHDDAHLRGGLSRRRHPHELRGHRLGDRRGSRAHRGPKGARQSVPPPARHCGWRGADRGPDHRLASTPESTCGGNSSRITARRIGSTRGESR